MQEPGEHSGFQAGARGRAEADTLRKAIKLLERGRCEPDSGISPHQVLHLLRLNILRKLEKGHRYSSPSKPGSPVLALETCPWNGGKWCDESTHLKG